MTEESPSALGRDSAQVVAELTRVRHLPGAGWPALRVILVLVVMFAVLAANDRMSSALFVSLGALTGVYGGRLATPDRWTVQLRLGVILMASVGIGLLVAVSGEHWMLIVIAALWASGATAASDRQGWRPPGPMFPVLAQAASAAAPITAEAAWPAFGVCVGTVVLSVVLGAGEAWWVARTKGQAASQLENAPVLADPRRRRLHAVRCGVAVLVTGALVLLLGIGHPYWAIVACVVPLAVPSLSG